MATMVKEKRREKKKKAKDKPVSSVPIEIEEPSCSFTVPEDRVNILDKEDKLDMGVPIIEEHKGNDKILTFEKVKTDNITTQMELGVPVIENEGHNKLLTLKQVEAENVRNPKELETSLTRASSENNYEYDLNYIDLNKKLERINISYDTSTSLNLSNLAFDSSQEANDSSFETVAPSEHSNKEQNQSSSVEDVCPSAPMFDEIITYQETSPVEKPVTKPKVQCMSMEEALRLFGGAEMAEIQAISEREEAIVEAGPIVGPEHPLVDLLSNFRCSLNALERERTSLARRFEEEERYRSQLWKVEKRNINITERCSCDATVSYKATYEHAELMKSQLPVAKMKLESLLKDVEQSYCHYQHAALLAHCQIEELISATLHSGKHGIREALSLILKELRLCDSVTPLSEALQRWAGMLAEVLVDGRDVRQLLFLLHHMCRQTRSVRWLSRLISITGDDAVQVSRAIALFHLVMTTPSRLRAACAPGDAGEPVEEAEEAWQELAASGATGAVSDGAMRERDLLSLFRAFPTADIIAKIVLFRHRDITTATPYEWGDGSGGRGVLHAAVGTRVLTAACDRAVTAHPLYDRLQEEIVQFALQAVCALNELYLHTRSTYTQDLAPVISAELDAVFASAFLLFSRAKASLHCLPFAMLSDDAAGMYLHGFISMLHVSTSEPIDAPPASLPAWVTCGARVRLATSLAAAREPGAVPESVLAKLFELGVTYRSPSCQGGCQQVARESLTELLSAHPYLYPAAFSMFCDFCMVNAALAPSIGLLSPSSWRPDFNELRLVLDHFVAVSCPALSHLLMQLDYTPHSGITLQTQVQLGAWLRAHVRKHSAQWAWPVLRRLTVHRIWWGLPLDIDGGDPVPFQLSASERDEADLFEYAYNLLATSWGHCVPLICTYGVDALHALAQAGRARDVTHCLRAIMLVMTQSPESISLTPKFAEVFAILLNSGPSILQRALGRGGESGTNMLLKLMLGQLTNTWNVSSVTIEPSSLFSVWLHSLWRGGAPLLEIGVLSTRMYAQLDLFVEMALQQEWGKEFASATLRNVSQCCALACSVLRVTHKCCETAGLWPMLLTALARQRATHVDNALKSIGSAMTSDELVIHKSAAALLAAPLSNPAHVDLWRLFFCLYLQRAPTDPRECSQPVGPLFFSGFVKSRVLNQLKKRLTETANYHVAESSRLKSELTPTNQAPAPTNNVVIEQTIGEVNLLSQLTLRDLIGESESNDSSDSESEIAVEKDKTMPERDRLLQDRITYHLTAEVIMKTYLCWLEEGDKVRAMPHHIRLMPEQASSAACKAEAARLTPASTPDDAETSIRSQLVTSQPETPFHRVVKRLTEYRRRPRRIRRRTDIRSPVDDAATDPRKLVSMVENRLTDIDRLANEWSTELAHLYRLDGELWTLVSGLRVKSPIPAVRRSCPNKCRTITLHIPQEQYCVNVGAQRGIVQNRSSAGAALRKLSRPRPDAARTAAALHTLTRKVSSAETASRILELIWRCTANEKVEACTPAKLVFTNIVSELAEKYICNSSARVCYLVSRWCRGSLSQSRVAVAGSLLSPRRLSATGWLSVYTELLRADVPAHTLFSYLSKFEITRWSQTASLEQRQSALEALLEAVTKHGPTPDESYHVLLELLGVHTSSLLAADTVSAHTERVCVAAARGTLVAAHWPHVLSAWRALCETDEMQFDQLGHLLRQVGITWWSSRVTQSAEQRALHAPHVAKLCGLLNVALLHACRHAGYDCARVSWYSWGALHESWGAWVLPAPGRRAALPPPAAACMTQQMCRHVAWLITECRGSEPFILQEVFEWASQVFPTCGPQWSADDRAAIADLLTELAKLPWRDHQWFSCRSMPTVLKICSSPDPEAALWFSSLVSNLQADSWLEGVAEEHLSPHLATLLYVFTTLPLADGTLEEATKLPWWRLPTLALEQAMDRFYAEHHSVTVPYHTLPCFRILLYASELSIHPTNTFFSRASASEKRLSAISLWVRAASAPTLHAHVADSTLKLLDTIARIAPALQSMEGEVVALLSRAITILCTEPAGTTALPVWLTWVQSSASALVTSCLSAVATLTVLEHYAHLADVAAQAHLLCNESGWSGVTRALRDAHWRSSHSLTSRGRTHVGYAACLSDVTGQELNLTLLALQAGSYNFVESEPILATWVCLARRLAAAAAAPHSQPRAAAGALLRLWGEAPRRSLLNTLTMSADQTVPTAKLRLLCRLALCILSPDSESAVKDYEATCAQVLGSSPGDVITWGRSPHPRKLPRLAEILMPKYKKYFQVEYELAPEEK